MIVRKYIFFLNILFLLNYSIAQITPNGKLISSSSMPDLSVSDTSAINYIIKNYYDVDVIQSSQLSFLCME